MRRYSRRNRRSSSSSRAFQQQENSLFFTPNPSVRATSVQRRQRAGTLSPAERERNMAALCIGREVGDGPTREPFTPPEFGRVLAATSTARWLASRAATALHSGDRYTHRMARRMFHLSRLNVPAMVGTITRILHALSSKPIVKGTCADETCNDAPVAYVPDDLASIVICPFTFINSNSQLIRTLLHEAGHAVGIDDLPDYEHPPYCDTSDRVLCDDPCEGIDDLLRNVDAWARFIECAGYSW